MGLTETGLKYVSKDADKFLKTVDKAINSVTKLNFTLFLTGEQSDKTNSKLSQLSKGLGQVKNLFDDNKKSVLQLASGQKKVADVVKDVTEKYAGLNTIFVKAKSIKVSDIKNNEQIAVSVRTVGDTVKNVTPMIQNYGKVAFDSFKNIPNLIKNSIPSFGSLKEVMNKVNLGGIDLGGMFGKLTSIISAIPAPVLAAVGAFIAFKVVGGILDAIGKRAAGLTAVAESFEKLRVSAGLSTDYLKDFTEQADNQLTQAESLILINKALAGSVGDFQKEMADSLPTLLEFARARSRATGEDVNFLFESLIQGIKKQQPLILDNLGLVVKLEEAYQRYADSLGISVTQLTGVQKQQAVLNAVNQEAVRNINILGSAVLSNADKIRAKENIYSDILDSISLAFQPLLGIFLDVEIFFAKLLGETLQPFISIVQSIFSVIASGVSFVFQQIQPLFEFLAKLLQAMTAPFEALFKVIARVAPIVFELIGWFTPLGLAIKAINFFLRPLTDLLSAVSFLFETIGDLVIGLINFLQFLWNIISGVISNALSPFVNSLSNLGFNLENVKTIITQLASLIAVGFGKAVAALVNVFAGAAKNILTIVADLAEGIADFLIGESPPPKGPLSHIDEGGKATFEAWLDGFTGLSLKPVEQVANEVNQSLGNIGSLSLPQVEKRLAKLDKALRPFEEQLEIVKSQFEAISKPAEAALNAIDRQLDKAVEALTKGDASAAEAVRALDAQRAAIIKNLDLQQQQVDFSQIQLALKQAQQSEERTLLEIQKKRLEGQKLTTDEIKKEKAILDKQAQQSASTGSGTASPASGIGSATPETSETGNQFGDLALAGFMDEIDLSNFEAIGEQQDRLAEQGGRIGEGLAGLPDRFANAFGEIFGPDGTIATLINDIFGPEGLFVTSITGLFSDTGFFRTTFNNIFGEEGFVKTIWNNIFGVSGFLVTQFNNLFGEEGLIGAVLGAWFGLGGFLSTQLDAGSDLFQGMYDAVFGENGVFSGVANALSTLIKTPLLTVLTSLENLINAFISYAESFLNGIIDSVEGLVAYIPTELRGSLNDLIGYQLVIPRVDFVPPQAAKGGIFTGGLMSVGERGKEYISPANKIGVFPNNFVTAIESLESVLVQSMNLGSYGNVSSITNNSNSNSSQVININQPTSLQTVRQQLSLVG